ncbi:50S ribosomal protein L25 [uncultured Clostridium sp.]|uniref:50S ribosomal protein L25 n=1 Tax=uncultured Clostridium sp. TaxID=59620 RepID=UPI0028EDBEE3|nr:50S ribosomal protein L25 [uncultured Clostridium sp.]
MEVAINAYVRNEKPKITKREGFIPGVIYGKDFENILVKFERNKLIGLLKEKGEKAKISYMLDNVTKEGIIKEVGRDFATGEIIHIDIQSVKGNDNVKWTIPIVFTGKELLNNKGLYLQVYSNEIDVEGEASLIPNNAEIEVSSMEFGKEIKIKDLNLNSAIKLAKDSETILAVVTNS